MTFGEKLKQARQNVGLSQEQLAEKLNVSRSAVAKWEANRGLPDVMNLKAVGQILDVSVDYLLDDGILLENRVIKETIDWSKYPREKWYNLKEDAVVLDKYPEAISIIQLNRKRKLNKIERVTDTALWLLTPLPPGTAEMFDSVRDSSIYYLVEDKHGLILVNVTKEFIISSRLIQKTLDKRFEIGENVFRKTRRNLI